jgi:phospholipid/cholesterol/gamma-HCH transport system permease protein
MAKLLQAGWRRQLIAAGDQVVFMGGFFRNVFRAGFEWNEFIRQCFIIGYKSWYYSSVSHLSAQFKKTTGLTPTFFKQLAKNSMGLENM